MANEIMMQSFESVSYTHLAKNNLEATTTKLAE